MPIRSVADLWDFLRDLKEEVDRDRVLAVAAGVTFYAILAIVPAITALISVFGLVVAPAEVPGILAPVTSLMPEAAATLIIGQAERISGTANDTLSVTALFALLIALWSANGGTKALIEALGIAYDVKETRGFVHLNLVALGFTLGEAIESAQIGCHCLNLGPEVRHKTINFRASTAFSIGFGQSALLCAA